MQPHGGLTRSLLVEIAKASVDGTLLEPRDIAHTAEDWASLVDLAEARQLAPLAYACLGRERLDVPQTTIRSLEALWLRHRAWHRERTAALTEILREFERLSIEALVLKGAALAWMIYPSPSLRPMSDIDLLVPPASAPAAQTALGRLGFRAERPVPRFGKRVHHLPIASRSSGRLPINVEIHVDALPRDTLSSIAIGNLTEPAQPFVLDGAAALTLGHVDTLRHLTHHVLEPSWDGGIRLLGLVDLFRYAATFHDRIEWPRLEKDYPFVVNGLGCFHHVIPLPPVLARFAPPTTAPIPARVGEAMRPLRWILGRSRPSIAVLRDLFNPPDWWLHAYYGVSAGRSLVPVRVCRHPWRMARWFGLRLSGSGLPRS
jgi:hypothetical protein